MTFVIQLGSSSEDGTPMGDDDRFIHCGRELETEGGDIYCNKTSRVYCKK